MTVYRTGTTGGDHVRKRWTLSKRQGNSGIYVGRYLLRLPLAPCPPPDMGTRGVSVGTCELLANLSKRLCRKRRYSSSLSQHVRRTLSWKMKEGAPEQIFRIGSRQLVQTLRQCYPRCPQRPTDIPTHTPHSRYCIRRRPRTWVLADNVRMSRE